MRIIAGGFRSRRLKTLEGFDTRPTPDRLRETLFNILAPVIEGAIFLDAYAGTGAVGIEALSRGAARAIFIERRRAAADVIRDNLRSLAISDRAEVLTGRVLEYLPHRKADIVFLDPPYSLQSEYGAALELLGRTATGLVIVQHDVRQHLENSYGGIQGYRTLRQGDNCLRFYRAAPSQSD